MRQIAHKPFADGAAHVHSPINTYVHLVCEPFANGLVHKCVPSLTHKFSLLFEVKFLKLILGHRSRKNTKKILQPHWRAPDAQKWDRSICTTLTHWCIKITTKILNPIIHSYDMLWNNFVPLLDKELPYIHYSASENVKCYKFSCHYF